MDVRRFGQSYRSPSYTLARTVENYETYYDIRYPAPRAVRGSAAAPVVGVRLARGPRRVVRREVRLGAGEPLRRERRRRRRGVAPGRLGRAALVARDRGRAPRDARARRASSTSRRSPRSRSAGRTPRACCEWVCDNEVARGVGSVTYTQALNARGGIECDFTVTQLDEQVFLVVTGTAFGNHDAAWLRTQARALDADVRIADVTGGWSCFGLWGPRRATILGAAHAARPGQRRVPVPDDARDHRRRRAGAHGARDLRRRARLGALLPRGVRRDALGARCGRPVEPHGLVAGGYRAIDSLRLEKGYRVWGADIDPAHTPYEAGLGFCVRLDKAGGFLGRDALVAQKEAGVTQRLRCLVLDDRTAVALGNEPVRCSTATSSGRVTSGGLGYTVGVVDRVRLPARRRAPSRGTRVEVGIFGELGRRHRHGRPPLRPPQRARPRLRPRAPRAVGEGRVRARRVRGWSGERRTRNSTRSGRNRSRANSTTAPLGVGGDALDPHQRRALGATPSALGGLRRPRAPPARCSSAATGSRP